MTWLGVLGTVAIVFGSWLIGYGMGHSSGYEKGKEAAFDKLAAWAAHYGVTRKELDDA